MLFTLKRFEDRDWVEPNLVYVFDRYREHLKNGILDKFAQFYSKFINQSNFVLVVNQVFDELAKLDFTEEVKGMKGSEIKEYVRQKKLEVVRKHV